MTSTPDFFAPTDYMTCLDQQEARNRFIALVADARTAVQVPLAASAGDGTKPVCVADDVPCGDSPFGTRAEGAKPSSAQRLERVVGELLHRGAERAQIRVVD